VNYWDVHGWLFLVGITLFPRLTMLFFTAAPWGWLAWLGWIVWPNLLAAVLATTFYWRTNPVLCVCAWLMVAGKGGAVSSRSSSD
jgi:hypothetical protein